MLIRSVIIVLVLACPSAAARAAQANDDTRNTRDLAAWLEAVTTHTPGQRDGPVTRVSQWTRDDVDRLLPAVSRLPPDERPSVVSRALVLHADIALFSRTTTGYELPRGDTAITLFADGLEVGQMFGTFHWDFGRRLIERLPRGEERTRIARVFYRSVGAVLQLWGEHSELQAHLRAATRIIGNDPVLLMYEGTLHQVYADARSQRFFDQQRQQLRDQSALAITGPLGGRGAMQPRVAARDLPPTVTRARSEAERAFRRALAADPALDEARVRLAHVLYDRGRHDDAMRELGRTKGAGPRTTFLDYYTTMLTGRVARALDRLDDAQAAFERGLALQPQAQAPRMALSELAMARGDAATARRYLTPLGAETGIDDPWWRVGRTHGSSARSLVDEMWGTLR